MVKRAKIHRPNPDDGPERLGDILERLGLPEALTPWGELESDHADAEDTPDETDRSDRPRQSTLF